MKKSNSTLKAYYILLTLILIFLLQPKGGSWAWIMNIRWFYVLLVSFVWAQLLTPVTIKLAKKFEILDYPCERKIHKQPIPRIGGLAIFAAIILSTVRNYQFSPELFGLIIGSSIIFVVGFIDDIYPLPATLRLILQGIACAVVIKSGIIITIIPHGWPFEHTLEIIITVIWLIGLANAYNFLDGVDGLLGGMATISALLFFLIAWPLRQSYLYFVVIAIAGACLGFLPYNWKPAKTFMGDASATFLGFIIAGIAVMGSWAYNNPIVAISTPLLILGIPIFDMIYTTISRIKNGQVKTFKEWLDYTGKDHFHHRLMKIGFSQKGTVVFIWTLNISLGLGALAIRDAGPKASVLIVLQGFIIFLIIVALMLIGKTAADD